MKKYPYIKWLFFRHYRDLLEEFWVSGLCKGVWGVPKMRILVSLLPKSLLKIFENTKPIALRRRLNKIDQREREFYVCKICFEKIKGLGVIITHNA